MLISLEQLQAGIIRFVENEIVPKATGIRKFGIYFMLPAIQKTVVDYVSKIKEFMPDLFDENGHIKLDILYNYAKNAIQKSGQFEFMGLIFNEADIDKLYAYIRN